MRVSINGGEPITFDQFAAENSFTESEIQTIRDTLSARRVHVCGGGAVATYKIEVVETDDEEAEVNAQVSEARINDLVREYEQWNTANGLDLGSADEHLFDESLTPSQREWLADFSRRWEQAERQEN